MYPIKNINTINGLDIYVNSLLPNYKIVRKQVIFPKTIIGRISNYIYSWEKRKSKTKEFKEELIVLYKIKLPEIMDSPLLPGIAKSRGRIEFIYTNEITYKKLLDGKEEKRDILQDFRQS